MFYQTKKDEKCALPQPGADNADEFAFRDWRFKSVER
jgi:hypothetical protein